MKIKCKVCEGQGFEVLPDRQGEPEQCPCPVCFATGEIDIEISTSELIAELERRRPCVQCTQHEYEYCTKCVFGPKEIKSNFKEAK